MALKVYGYKNCGTCRKAEKFLEANGLGFESVAIREIPPTPKELKQMLAYVGELKLLFNRSGLDYRSLGMKDKLPQMSESEAIQLLSMNGNLVKRPFLLSENWGTVGFKEDEWKAALIS